MSDGKVDKGLDEESDSDDTWGSTAHRTPIEMPHDPVAARAIKQLGERYEQAFESLRRSHRGKIEDLRKAYEAGMREIAGKIDGHGRRLITLGGENGNEGKVGELSASVDELHEIGERREKRELDDEKFRKAEAKTDRRWRIGQVITLLTAAALGLLSMYERLDDVEDQQAETDRTIDRVEATIDRIGMRLGVVPQPDPAPTADDAP